MVGVIIIFDGGIVFILDILSLFKWYVCKFLKQNDEINRKYIFMVFKVLVVDDLFFYCCWVCEIFDDDRELEVVGEVKNG